MKDRLSILWHYAQARCRFTRWSDHRSLEHWQERQVGQHLRFIAARSPHFGKLAQLYGIDRWRDWSVGGKSEMIRHFDEWNTAGIRLEEAWHLAVEAERTRDFSVTLNGVTVGLSSGTSGARGLFLASGSERHQWAGVLLARVLRGTLFHEHRAAMFLRADSPLYQTVGSHRLRFEFFDLLQPMRDHHSRLRALRPTVLAAPPSVLAQLADEPWSADLLAPPAILLSVADVLDDADRERIERGFGCRVGQIYQASEGFLAATCPHGRLHWNEDVVVVEKEWLDAARTRYSPIITDFRRLTQPIVRHRLEDLIVEGDQSPCACGSVFGTLQSIEGRCDDILTLARSSGGGQVQVFPDFVRRAMVLALPVHVEYGVVQTSPATWEIATSRPCDRDAIRREISELCVKLGAQMPVLRDRAWNPPRADAKRRRVRRQIPETPAS